MAVETGAAGRPRRRLAHGLVAATALSLAAAGAALAQPVATASPTPPADAPSLQAQVRSLSALVQSIADKDQAEIAALKAQVKDLQARLDSQTAAAPDTAIPRAGQNAANVGGAALAQAPPSAGESNAAVAATAAAAKAAGASPRVVQAILAQPRVIQNETHIFSLQSPSGQYSISLAGVAQFDAGDYLSFRAASRVVGPQALSNGVNARRARIGFAGTAAGDWSYAFIYDAGNSQDTTGKGIETAQIVYGGFRGLALELGYSNTFFTLDQSTSSNDLMFLERSTPTNIATAFNTGDNRANAGVRAFGKRYWLGGYLTGPAIGDSHTLTAERFGAFERAAYQIVAGRQHSLHLGVGVDELFQAPNSGNGTPQTLTLSDPPELRIDPTALLNTGAVGTVAHPVTGGYVFDLETAATFHSLFWQGEYYHYRIDREGLPGAGFDGAYGQIAWALTGETHRYNPQAGAYFRLLPAHPFSLKDGGLGAFEVAARVSYVDLIDNYTPNRPLASELDAVNGGRQAAYTLGLNWYPNDLVRFMLDYDHVDFDKSNGAAVTGAALGVPVGAHLDAISLRSQVVF